MIGICGKGHEGFMFCCDCGLAVKRSKLFVKSYYQTALCLCKRCAKKLAKEIKEKFTEEGKIK